MNAFVPYSIPIQGLKTGEHRFEFNLDDAFFALFEGSPVQSGSIDVEVELEKRSDMLLFDFVFSGTVKAECDRCTAQIDLPVEDNRQLIAKYGSEEIEEEDEVVFIDREASEFNLAKYLYEFVVLALPITNVYDCQDEVNPPCNFEVLKHLSSDEPGEKRSSVWDELKNLKDN